MKRRHLIVLTTACTVAIPVLAEDWPHFTGPDYTNASGETRWSSSWNEPKTAWKAEVGTGAASFTVKGNRVLTTGNENDMDIVWCFDLDSGKALWKHSFPCEFEKRSFEGGTAATPTIDGDFVYNLSYDGQLHCLKLVDGSVVWKKHLVEDFGGKLPRWKYAGAPLVAGNVLIVDAGGRRNSTLALNKTTGEKVWGAGSEGAGYATPISVTQNGRPAVVVFKGEALVCLDFSSGKQLWEVPWKTSYDVNASSPVKLPNQKLLVSSGYGGGRAALLDISSRRPRQLWRNDDIKTKMSSCVATADHVFAVSGDNGGKLICAGLADGKTKWSQGGFGFGTLALAGDRLIVLGESGNLVIAKASGSGYQPLAQAQILGRPCWVKPVLSDGRLLCKNNKGVVVCLDLRG